MPYGGSIPKTTTLAERLAAQGQTVPAPVHAAAPKRAPFSMVDSVPPTRPVLAEAPASKGISSADALCDLSEEREEMLKRCVSLGDGPGLCLAAVNSLPGPHISLEQVYAWHDKFVELKKAGKLSAEDLPKCIDCGQPRSVGSAERCRTCYEARAARERRVANAALAPAPATAVAATSSFKIEKGIPLPPPEPPAKYLQYPWDEMDVGDSFFVAGVKAASMASMSRCAGQKSGRKYTCRQERTGVRVWRIA